MISAWQLTMCPLPFAGVCKGRAASGIIVCPQQKPWTKQVERFCSLHLYLPQLFLINFCVQGMAVFATPSWPSRTSGLHPYLVLYLEERWKVSSEKLVVVILRTNPILPTGDFWRWDSRATSTSSSCSAPVDQHDEGLLGSFSSI